jgi:uncharacterized protein (TIGR02246 family)
MIQHLGPATRLTAAVMVVLGASALVGAQRDAGAHAAVRSAIDAVNRKFVAAAAKADAASIAALYAQDGAAYPANSEAVKGRTAVQAMWKAVFDAGITAVELNTVEVDTADDLASEVGTYVMKTKDGSVTDRGKYLVVWKRVAGQWFIQHDIWTTSLAAAQK